MRVEQAFLECVFFVCIDASDDSGVPYRKPIGTGFKVAVPSSPGKSYVYLVTARHVVEEADTPILWIRFNRLDSGFKDIETARSQWQMSVTDDVAAFRMDVPTILRERINDRRVHLSSFIGGDFRFRTDDMIGGLMIDGDVTKSVTQDEGIPVQTGDDLFIVGLFSQHYGVDKNIPIARFGRIAAMPAEPVRMKRFSGASEFSALAYLIESMSWGGISGSPVFWTTPMLDFADIGGALVPVQAYKIALLGLVSGHFGIEQEAQSSGDVILENEGRISTELNAGIAVVTPASAVEDLLMSDSFVLERERLQQA